jgi:hypothetical protein
MTIAFSLTQTRERLSAFAAATTMTLAVMAGISTLAHTERAEGVLQAQAQPVLEAPVQRVVVTGARQALHAPMQAQGMPVQQVLDVPVQQMLDVPVQQVHVTGQRLPRT